MPNEMNLQKTPPQQQHRDTIVEVANLLKQSKDRIADILPKIMTPARLFGIVRTTLATNSRLVQCHPASICGAVMQSVILGLEPNTPLGHSFLIPFWNKRANAGRGGYEAQLIIGAKGKIQLLIRSGFVAGCTAKTVREFDEFELLDGLDPDVRHRYPKSGTRGEVIGFWGGIKLSTGFKQVEYMSKEEMEEHRDRFALSRDRQGKVFGPWADHFAAMGIKTMIHKVAKHAPMSPQVAQAWNLDAQAEKGRPQQFSSEVPTDMWQVGALDEEHLLEHPEEATVGEPVEGPEEGDANEDLS
jgi:recombination protein RecT